MAVCGSTIVNVPPVQFIPELSCKRFNIGVPEATEPVVLPPLLPSILILPALWLKVEPKAQEILPLTFKVPPLTVKVPLLVSGVLFKVQPTVKSPEETTNVPPELMVMFLETLLDELTVTVCVEAIVMLSPQVGIVPLLQVEVAFQFPEAIEVMGGTPGVHVYFNPEVGLTVFESVTAELLDVPAIVDAQFVVVVTLLKFVFTVPLRPI